jgi:aliphatic nitrilase
VDVYPKYKAAVIQAAPEFLDREASTDKACKLIAEAGRQGAKLIAFPEAWLPGYPWFIWVGTPQWWSPMYSELVANGVEVPSPTTDRLCQAAKDAGAYLVVGVEERDGGTLYCTQLFIDSDGQIMGKHRKLKPTHLERAVWGQGDGSDLKVFPTPLGRIGGLNCWEHLQALTRYTMHYLGEQVHVASWPAFSNYAKYVHAFTSESNVAVTRSYALEGACFALMSTAPISKEMIKRLVTTPEAADLMEAGGGCSQIFGPDGKTIAGPACEEEETILYAEIDLAQIVAAKNATDCVGHYSRPDVFTLLVNFNPQPQVLEVGSSTKHVEWTVATAEGRNSADAVTTSEDTQDDSILPDS